MDIQNIPGLYELIYESEYGNRFKILQDIVITIRNKLNWTPLIKRNPNTASKVPSLFDIGSLQKENPKVMKLFHNVERPEDEDNKQIKELLKYIIEEMIIYLNDLYNLPCLLEDEIIDTSQICYDLIQEVKKYGTN